MLLDRIIIIIIIIRNDLIVSDLGSLHEVIG